MIPVLVDCDPGLDDAIALLLVLASPELELLGVTTVAGNQTRGQDDRERAQGARAGGAQRHSGGLGGRPPSGRRARHRRRRARRDRGSGSRPPDAPEPNRVGQHAVDFLAERLLGVGPPGDALRPRPAHERRSPPRADGRKPRAGSTGSCSWAARSAEGNHDRLGRVQHLDRPRGGRTASSRAAST